MIADDLLLVRRENGPVEPSRTGAQADRLKDCFRSGIDASVFDPFTSDETGDSDLRGGNVEPTGQSLLFIKRCYLSLRRLACSTLDVEPIEVVHSRCGCAVDGGVMAVEIVVVDPGLESASAVGF